MRAKSGYRDSPNVCYHLYFVFFEDTNKNPDWFVAVSDCVYFFHNGYRLNLTSTTSNASGFFCDLLRSNERIGLLIVLCGQALVLVFLVVPFYRRQTDVMNCVPDLFLKFWVKFFLWCLVLGAYLFAPTLKELSKELYCSWVSSFP